MRVVITNYGTRGDFEPFFALASELIAHHHDVLFAIPESAVQMLQQAGYDYSVIAIDDPDIRRRINLAWSIHPDAYDAKGALVDELSTIESYLPAALNALTEICADATVLISGPTQPLARIVHEMTGVPFVSVQMGHFGGNGGPAVREAGDRLVNPFRRKIGLPPVKDPFTTGANSPQLALYAMSRYLLPRPPTWPSHYRVTGFFFADRTYQPPPQLAAFLQSGPAPVIVTLGSMPHESPQRILDLIMEALTISGSRALLQGFGLSSGVIPHNEQLCAIDYIPHTWLFRFASCVVSHGGAGTAAAVFRSGVPGIFVPHGEIYDQRYLSQLAHENGYAVPAIPLHDLASTTLAYAVEKSQTDHSLRKRALDLGNKIRSERGVETARQMIERTISSLGLA